MQQTPKPRNSPGSMASSRDSGFGTGTFCESCRASLTDPVHNLSHSMQTSSVTDRAFEASSCYKMDHAKRGVCLIINNTKFEKNTKMSDRKGSDIDASNLYRVFKDLKFDVDLQNNQTITQMFRLVEKISKQDHSNCDCFVMVILSHGDEGIVYGTDGFIKMDSLIAPLKANGCRSLVGKPKLFFIQACRGTQFDEGVDVADAVPGEQTQKDDERVHKIPVEADFLYAYSSPAGHYSFRHNTKGSWFVQAVTRVFEEEGTKKEIMQLLTRVNRTVAEEFESRAKNPEHSGKKQIPSIVSMLTRELYFTQKKK